MEFLVVNGNATKSGVTFESQISWLDWLSVVKNFALSFVSLVVVLSGCVLKYGFGRAILWTDICLKTVLAIFGGVLIGFAVYDEIDYVQRPIGYLVGDSIINVWGSGVITFVITIVCLILELSYLLGTRLYSNKKYEELALN